jgi:deferrochelatase/peroxidase EfeB
VIAGLELDDAAVLERGGRRARDHQADVLDLAARLADAGADVQRPLPARLVGGAADRQAADVDDLEAALLHLADLVRRVEAFQYDVDVHRGRAEKSVLKAIAASPIDSERRPAVANLVGITLLSLGMVVSVAAGRAVLGVILTALVGTGPKPPLA